MKRKILYGLAAFMAIFIAINHVIEKYYIHWFIGRELRCVLSYIFEAILILMFFSRLIYREIKCTQGTVWKVINCLFLIGIMVFLLIIWYFFTAMRLWTGP